MARICRILKRKGPRGVSCILRKGPPGMAGYLSGPVCYGATVGSSGANERLEGLGDLVAYPFPQ